jgi:hypothetical protein
MPRSHITVLGLVGATLILIGCNSGSDSSTSATTTTTNASATGVWSGTDSVSNLAVTAFINSAGEAEFISASGAQLFVGTVQISGSTFDVAVDGYSNFGGTAFSDGSTYGVGTVTGTIVSGSTLTATLSFTTSGGTAITGTWTLSFDVVSNSGSSLSAISGNYTDGATGATVAIDGTGDISSQDANTGCVLTGTVSTTDTTYDVYQLVYTYKNCVGTYAALNGFQLSGLAVLNTSVSPTQLDIAVTGGAAGTSYGIVDDLNAT